MDLIKILNHEILLNFNVLHENRINDLNCSKKRKIIYRMELPPGKVFDEEMTMDSIYRTDSPWEYTISGKLAYLDYINQDIFYGTLKERESEEKYIYYVIEFSIECDLADYAISISELDVPKMYELSIAFENYDYQDMTMELIHDELKLHI